MLASLAWVAVVASEPLHVQVVSLSDATGPTRAAEGLAAALASDERLRVRTPLTAPPADDSSEASLRRASERVSAARRNYQQLDPQPALARVTENEVELRQRLDDAEAQALLAESLRIKGLVLLFLDRKDGAAAAFVSASFLAPEFSPPAEEWPPQARLSYADTLAAVRRAPAGALSVQVTPAFARVYLDRRELGLGSTTIHDLAPGAHHLLVTCPGYDSFAAAVRVDGDGKLSDTAVFLQARGDEKAAAAHAVTALALAWNTADEEIVARQVLGVFGVDLVVVVTPDALDAAPAPPVAWLIGAEGRRRGGSVLLSSPAAAAGEISAQVWGDAAADAGPWYRRWYVWAATGATVALTTGLVVWAARDAGPKYRDIVIGRTP